jgi:hypothetical protein
MARVRMLKPSFFTHTRLGKRSPLARLVFQSLWCLADRKGRLKDDPEFIKINAIPHDDANVDELLDDLATMREEDEEPFIVRYRIGRFRFIQIVNFARHQNPHPKEPPSMIPAPPGEEPRPDVESHGQDMTGPVISAPSPSDPDPGSSGPSDTGDALTRSYVPDTGTVHWVRRLYRPLWEELYSGAMFASSRGDQTAWENHLAANPEAHYRDRLFGDLPRLLKAYLADRDQKLLERRHPLAFFPERLSKYRAPPAPARSASPIKPLDVEVLLGTHGTHRPHP